MPQLVPTGVLSDDVEGPRRLQLQVGMKTFQKHYLELHRNDADIVI